MNRVRVEVLAGRLSGECFELEVSDLPGLGECPAGVRSRLWWVEIAPDVWEGSNDAPFLLVTVLRG